MSKRKQLTPERIAQLRACPVMHVHEAQQIYGLGRNRLYDLMNDGTLPFTKNYTESSGRRQHYPKVGSTGRLLLKLHRGNAEGIL